MHEEATENVTLAPNGSLMRSDAHLVDRAERGLAPGCLLAARSHSWYFFGQRSSWIVIAIVLESL